LSCRDIDEGDLDDIVQCLGQNGESLKCLDIITGDCFDLDENNKTKLATAINKCNKLEELHFFTMEMNTYMDLMRNLPQNIKKICLGNIILTWPAPSGLKVEEFKVLVATCNKLEDLFITMHCSCTEISTCHHFDEIISIIAGSSLSDTLINLSLTTNHINVHEQFGAKCLELGQMKKLKKIEIEIGSYWNEETEHKQVNDVFRKNVPHLTIVQNRQQENFFTPYAKHDKSCGFWEVTCKNLLA